MAPSRERLLFLLLAALAGMYVVLRAALVPWVHDECASLFWFVERGEYLPWKAHWDANNHVLSSAIGTAVYRVAGLGLFASRIGSVLAFVAYAWAAYHLGRRLQEPLIRWCLWAALLACPFVIEFFSLFRGYGLELAFWLVALEGLLRLVGKWRTSYLVVTLAALFLANAAVLALLPIWALIVAALCTVFLWKWRSGAIRAPQQQLVTLVAFGVVPMVLGALFAFALRDRGLLYHGSTEGFMAVTVSSLLRYTLGVDGVLAGTSVLLIALFASVTLLIRVEGRGALALMVLVLWADVAIRITMAVVLDVNYPKDRAAIHLVPLFVLVVAFAVDRISGRWTGLRLLALVLLVLPLRTFALMNLSATGLWPEQSLPQEVVRALLRPGSNGNDVIGAYHQHQLVVPYGARLLGLPAPLVHWADFPHGHYDRMLVDARVTEADKVGHHKVACAPGNGVCVFERGHPIEWKDADALDLDGVEGSQEFVELWRGDTVPDDRQLSIVIEGDLSSMGRYADVELVAKQKDREGRDTYYQSFPMGALRPIWSGEAFHYRILMPPVPGCKERVLYFWNVHKQRLRLGPIRVRESVLSTSSDH